MKRRITLYRLGAQPVPHVDESGHLHICIHRGDAERIIDAYDRAGGDVSKGLARRLGRLLEGMSEEGWRNLKATTPEPTDGTGQSEQGD